MRQLPATLIAALEFAIAQAAGADYYCTKPFSLRALLDCIYHILGE